MKYRLCFYIILLTLWSCSKSEEKLDVDNSKISKSLDSTTTSSNNKPITSGIPVNSKLPFGSKTLVTYNFPKYWEIDFEDGMFLPNKHSDKLDEAYSEIGTLNAKKGTLSLQLERKEPINLAFPMKFVDTLAHNIDSIKYRLPNIGPYESFYSYTLAGNDYYSNNVNSDDYPPYGVVSGNLILYNPITKEGKIINLFMSVQAPFSGFQRMFYINEKGIIFLFETVSKSELGMSFQKRYTVTVKDNGEIYTETHK